MTMLSKDVLILKQRLSSLYLLPSQLTLSPPSLLPRQL